MDILAKENGVNVAVLSQTGLLEVWKSSGQLSDTTQESDILSVSSFVSCGFFLHWSPGSQKASIA